MQSDNACSTSNMEQLPKSVAAGPWTDILDGMNSECLHDILSAYQQVSEFASILKSGQLIVKHPTVSRIYEIIEVPSNRCLLAICQGIHFRDKFTQTDCQNACDRLASYIDRYVDDSDNSSVN